MENANAGVLPGTGSTDLLSESEKEIYASCVGSSVYLSQDRADLKFAVQELSRRLHAPRRCDFQNLKIFARYLIGTKNYDT